MEKERLKLPYVDVSLDILEFSVGDVIATSGGSGGDQGGDYSGPDFSGSGGWT